MISYIKGKVEDISENTIIIDNNGIGYCVFVTPSALAVAKRGSDVKIYTYMNVKEDCLQLYGFFSNEELNVFNRLITVSGIGPKVAMSVINTMKPQEIVLAIVTDDVKALSTPVGMGKKTAQRMILELKDKMKTSDAVSDFEAATPSSSVGDGVRQDAVEALLVLGYGRSEAVKTVMQIPIEGATVESVIKAALKILSAR